jgi:DNA-directed RNA polymerase specialized sigma24 family protein
MTDDELDTVLDLSAKVASRYAGRGVWWADREEMAAVARAAMVRARETYDPATGLPWGAYAWTAGLRAVRNSLWRESAPVSAPSGKLRELAGLYRADESLFSNVSSRESSPEDQVEDDEWTARVVRAVQAHAAPDGELDGRIALDVLLRELTPAEVAEANGLPVRRVYRAVRRVRARMEQSLDMYELWKEMR